MHGTRITPRQDDSRWRQAAAARTISAVKVSQLAAYLGAVALVGFAVLVRRVLQPVLPDGFPFLTFYPAVILTAYLFGARATVLHAVLALAASWFFFIGPESNFALGVRAPVAMATFLFVAMLVAAMMHTMQVAILRLETERDNSARLAENREVLYRELQHRVGNSLQMVSSILSLQKHKLREAEAVNAMDEAIRRVALIGKVQRQLFDPDGAAIPLRAFLHDICTDLHQVYGKPGVRVEVTGAAGLSLAPNLAMPVALIVAESLVNAFEHGFAEREDGDIAIDISPEDKVLTITISDDGIGPPPGFSAAAVQSMGLRLAHKLASYNGGSYDLERIGDRTVARLSLPLKI